MTLLDLINKNKKVIGINFTLLTIFILLPPFLLLAIDKKRFFSTHKSEYLVYKNKEKSRKIFSEINKLSSQYKSFIGWRRQSIKSEYTNINDKYNPNGSISSIAGIINHNKRILGMMPHPERMIDESLGDL